MRTTFRMVCLAASGALAAVSIGFSAELETERWQREIDAASAAGGGTVTVPAGEHRSGTLRLKDGVTLRLEKGAVLKASTNYADYVEMDGPLAFIWAKGASRVAIEGEGEINGSGRGFPCVRQTPRPRLVRFDDCRDVRVEGVTLRDSARWTLYLAKVDGFAVRRIRIRAHANWNNDGIDIKGRNGVIEDCDIDSEDDSIVFKAHEPDYVVENVKVRRCRLSGNTNAIKIGSETFGTFRNIEVSDCEVRITQPPAVLPYMPEIPGLAPGTRCTKIGIAVEMVDGGTIDGVTIRNITIDQAQTPVFVRLGRRNVQEGRRSVLRNVLIENVKAIGATRVASSVTGVPGCNVEDITIRNVELTLPGGGTLAECAREVPENEKGYPTNVTFGFHPLPAAAFYIRHADRIRFEGVSVKLRSPDERPLFFGTDATYDAIRPITPTFAAGGRHPPRSLKDRVARIAPVKPGELRLRPTFSCVGICYGSRDEVGDLVLESRKAGAADWTAAERPPYFTDTAEYRGSIFGLEEDAEYEIRLRAGGRTLAGGRIRTWAGEVPVARTVVIDPATAKFPMTVSDRGTPDGWVRYTTAPGAKLVRDATDAFFRVEGAEYVLFDDMTLEGGGGAPERRCPISIENSRNVRVRNCEFSGWGRTGKVDYTSSGKGRAYAPKREFINGDGAIRIGRGSSCIVVERCYFHDPRWRSNSWFYSHPAGNEAIVMCCPDHSTVLRWNDFIGSDAHRWNDAVEGEGNFDEDGGFNRDADICGNFMIYANDDCIELDGGQQNVRCFGNRFESALCGVSIQGCMVSPSYVIGNDFTGMGDEMCHATEWIKVSGYDVYSAHPVTYVTDNVFSGRGGFGSDKLVRGIVARNEFVEGDRPIRCRADVPVRPLPFALDRGRLDGVRVSRGTAVPASQKVTMRWTGSADGQPVRFRIRQNDVFDWFRVEPAEETIGPGKEIELTVTYDAAKMNDRRFYRGAFLVRTPEGLSRVCSVVAETDFVPPFEAAKPGETAIYLRHGPETGTRHEYEVDVLKDGKYYLLIHGQADGAKEAVHSGKDWPTLKVSVDGSEEEVSIQQVQHYPTWTMLTPGCRQGCMIRRYDWKAGRHTVIIGPNKGKLTFDGLCVTDSPASFEPR